MRLWDYLALARHGLHRGCETAGVLAAAAAVTALCFSGAVLAAVQEEKGSPCELSVAAPSYMAVTEQSVQDFRAIARVVDATGVVEVPVTAGSGKYTAGLTLVGLDGDYLDGLVYTVGEPFPESGAMPWIALSEAAARSFADPEDRTKHGADYMPDIDWLDADFSLEMGERAVSAKVSGIFAGEEPAAYISQSAAKTLLQNQGLPAGYAGALVRVTNIGAAEAVSEVISGLGYQVENRDSARQERWDAQTREAIYLAVLAAAGFLCAGLLRLTGSALSRERARRRETLRWAGMSGGAVRGLDLIRGAYLDLAGAALGTGVHYLTAAFAALGGASSGFGRTLPPSWLALPLGVCVLTGAVFSKLASRNSSLP